MLPAARYLRVDHLALLLLAAGCAGDGVAGAGSGPAPVKPSVAFVNANQAATVGAAFIYDASLGNTVFIDHLGKGLRYSVTFTPAANGLTATGPLISGAPSVPGTTLVTITATDSGGGSASNIFRVVAFDAGLKNPVLPVTPFAYSDIHAALPGHFLAGPGSPAPADNTPVTNPITDPGAALGRVLFYDLRLSDNDAMACGSCHHQATGFSDPAQRSRGFTGGLTRRHSMGLANARYYQRGRFFWDERAATLEDQVVTPIQDAVEMGMSLDNLEAKLALVPYYPPLFNAAFGSPVITRGRIANALAQFVRSMTSYRSRYDAAFASGPPPNFAGVLTPQELLGLQLFGGAGPVVPGEPVLGCDKCHGTVAQIAPGARNNGLDAVSVDDGAGGGRFKSPSLRNVAVRAPYMHDGRFATLKDVVEFYNSGVQPHPNLDQDLRDANGAPRRLNLTATQVDALVAFLGALTDSTFLTDPRLSSPFPP